MSMEISGQQDQLIGTPELAPLGKRIEMLRIERGLSKQQLAKAAGISRQQLWRVLAGKSDLTSSLCERLALVLGTDTSILRSEQESGLGTSSTFSNWLTGRPALTAADSGTTTVLPQLPVRAATFAEFVGGTEGVRELLAMLPTCDDGLALKRAVLDAIEDVAIARGVALPAAFFELRRAVITRAI